MTAFTIEYVDQEAWTNYNSTCKQIKEIPSETLVKVVNDFLKLF